MARGIARVVLTTVVAGACLAFPAWAGAAVLYDQTNQASGQGVFSQKDGSAVKSEVADDFAVPTGQSWTIQSVDVTGLYDSGGGPVPSLNVHIYSNAGNLPGAALFDGENLVPTNTAGPSFSIPIPAPPVLSAGTYWLSVEANLSPYPTNVWDWATRTAQSGNPSVIDSPVLVAFCPRWTVRGGTCPTGAGGPDQLFRLNGIPNTVPGGSTPGKKRRCKKKKHGHHASAAKKKCKKKH
jgi:hypothetical protein